MKVNKVLIISNSKTEQSEVRDQLFKLPYIFNIKEVESLNEALQEVLSFRPTIILVDLNCICFEKLRILCEVLPFRTPIISLSDNLDHAVESYNTGIPVDFILKPVKIERLELAFARALKQIMILPILKKDDSIFLKMSRVFKKFYLDDIIYIEAYGMYSKVYTLKGKFVINESIMALEGKLVNDSFVRVHKSYLVNTTKIIVIKSNNLEMEMGQVPVGANYRPSYEGFLNIIKRTHPNIQ